MATAYKCDRCGKFYDEELQKYPYNPMIFICSGNVCDHSADLCEACYESFMVWWNKPTVKRFHISNDSPYICTVTGDEYVCMGGCGYKSGTQCMDDSEDSTCGYRALSPNIEEVGTEDNSQ